MINKKTTSENRRILQIAVPSIISNITVPLLGLIDVTIVGHLGSPAYIGAIAVGGMLFNIIYWIFGFLRMGTSGMTSQAYGQHDLNEINRLLIRSVGVGLFIALCLLILQYPILNAAFTLIQTTEEVKQLATTYFYICIWGGSGNARSLWICRLVYRNAELTLPDVYCHHAEYCQYYRQFVFRLSLGYESGRSRRRNPYRTVCRFLYGHTIVYALLQHAPKTYCMERYHTEAGNVPFLPGKP